MTALQRFFTRVLADYKAARKVEQAKAAQLRLPPREQGVWERIEATGVQLCATARNPKNDPDPPF